MSAKQDALLRVIESEANVELLYDLWQLVKACPSKAAEILVQFRDVNSAAKEMTIELGVTMDRFEALRKRLPDVRETSAVLREANRELVSTDDKALNRLNRIIDTAEKLRELKATGALELLRVLK